MPEVRLDALAAIRFKHRLWCYCLQCKRDKPLDLDKLAERIGWDAPLLGLKSRLRCSRCGSREVQTSLVYTPPPSTAVGYISLRS